MKGVPDISAQELEALTDSGTSLTRLFEHVDGALVSAFQNARNEKAHRKAQQEAKVKKREEAADKDRQKENQQSTDTHIFIQVLHQIDQRIAYLEERMAERYELLKVKYGEDVIGGMAATYLTDEELAGLETDEERCRAMAARFLDEDGEIKPEYRHLDDAEYIRDWYEVQKLEGLSTKLESRQTLNADDQAMLGKVLQDTPLATSKNFALLSGDEDLRNQIDQSIDANEKGTATTQHPDAFKFD